VEDRELLIRCVGLKKTYRMRGEIVYALKGVDLELYRGEYISIMGPSGSGKSTLFNMIGGLDTPSEGRVETTVSIFRSYPRVNALSCAAHGSAMFFKALI
jgi:ABC-type lipoprotein export system ATPase subunit